MLFSFLIFLNLSLLSCHEILFCNFIENPDNFYSCDLEISSNYGSEDYSKIHGRHLRNLTLDDVTKVSTFGFSLNFPSKVCESFDNLVEVSSPALGLSEIYESSFKSCENLEILDLNENSINKINENSFINNRKISQLSIAKSRLTLLSEKVFANLQNLRNLDLSENFFDFLPSNLFKNLRLIEKIDLRNSRLSSFNGEWFKTLNNLKFLDLSENSIDEIPRNSFSSQNILKVLNLNRNKIQKLDFLAFQRLENLEELHVAGNEIKSLDFNILELAENLKIVDFGGNYCFSGTFNNFDTQESNNFEKFENCFEDLDLGE